MARVRYIFFKIINELTVQGASPHGRQLKALVKYTNVENINRFPNMFIVVITLMAKFKLKTCFIAIQDGVTDFQVTKEPFIKKITYFKSRFYACIWDFYASI